MGKMLFTGNLYWTDDYAGPAMLAPPFFAMVCLAVLFGYLMSYVLWDVFYQWRRPYVPIPQAVKSMEDLDDRRLSSPVSLDDSANETSDGEPQNPSCFGAHLLLF